MKSKSCVSSQTGKPVTVYPSEYQAQQGAYYVNAEYGEQMSPYKCHKCGLWHLSPIKRQTPSSKCTTCTDRNGHYKELYISKKAAELRAEIIKNEKNVVLGVYRCPNENGWHLTKG